jgi:DNA repair exonuclease SbcCD nuclease subunit
VLQFALEGEYDLVICTGDVFHSKKAGNVSYLLTNRLCEIYREFPCLFIVPGNHDIDTQMEWRTRPLGILSQLPNVRVLHDQVEVWQGLVIAGWGGGEFFPMDDALNFIHNFAAANHGGLFKLLIAHLPISDLSAPFPVYSTDLIPPSINLTALGHIHNFSHIGAGYVATGSLSRGVLALDEDLYRPIFYGHVEIEDGHFSAVLTTMEVRPVEEVFNLEKKLAEVDREGKVAEFLQFADNFELPKSVTVEEVIQLLRSSEDIPIGVKKKAIEILEDLI